MNPEGTYVVPSIVDFDGLTFTHAKNGRLHETQRKVELLHFGYVVEGEGFRSAMILSSIVSTTTLRYQGKTFSSPILRLPTLVMCGC
jgi:hypothetical protein